MLQNWPLKTINIIIFPDWSQPEDILLQDLASAIRVFATHPDKNLMTLLIDTSNIAEEEANLALSGVVMNLMMEEELDVSEEAEIFLVGKLNEMDWHWHALLPCIHARIMLENENKQALIALRAENIPAYELDSFRKKKAMSLRFEQPYKLHIGCGHVKFDGWINIDVAISQEAVDLVWDATQKMPFEDESCMLIYNEHFLEHLTVEQGLSFLKECRRVLKPGGILRIAMPCLESLVQAYTSEDWRKNQDWLTWPDYQFIHTRAEMLNIAFRWWGHQWLYDREELYRRLREAGFVKIRNADWGMSDVPALINRETRKDSILICEAEV